MIKLLAIDIDGTLIKNDHSLALETKSAIKAAEEKGVKIVLATGRPPAGVSQYANMLEFKDDDNYIITHNGALVDKAVSLEPFLYSPISGKDFKELYKIGKELGYLPYAFDREYLIGCETNKYFDEEIKANGTAHKLVNLDEIDDDSHIMRVLFSQTKEFLDENTKSIPVELKQKYCTMRSFSTLYEFLKKGVNKGYALSTLANHLNIKQEEVMAIGDSENDVEMVKFAKIGVAMENAMDIVKQNADFITKSNEENGVAYAIHKFIL